MVLFSALRTVLRSPRRIGAFAVLVVAFFAVLVLVPVWTIPGNDVLFQLSITPAWVLVLMIALALGNGLIVTMQLHLHREHAVRMRGRDVAAGGGLLVTALVATLACTACYSTLLALLGFSAVSVIAAHRGAVAVLALGLTAWALFTTARRVSGVCTRCNDLRQR